MEHEPNEDFLKEIAAQLRCPDGEQGIVTGKRMEANNANMIRCAIDSLDLQEEDHVLEIGPGMAAHLPLLLDAFPSVGYNGIDISETMVKEACRLNKHYCETGQATFDITDGEHIPFSEDTFGKVFTVNTLYFWKDPLAYLEEIKRVTRPGGILAIAFATKEFMSGLPFTQYGFELYNPETVAELTTEAGWTVKEVLSFTEQVQTGAEEFAEREFIVLVAEKTIG